MPARDRRLLSVADVVGDDESYQISDDALIRRVDAPALTRPTFQNVPHPANRIPEAGRHYVTERRYLGSVARLADMVFDCERPASLAHWWASTLDGYRVAPHDSAELERLRDMGVFDPEDDPMVLVESALGEGHRYLFQRVPEPERHKNRLHLDLRCDDLEAEGTRLVDRGP